MTNDVERIPVRCEVDLLVVGGTSGAVSCALAAAARGLTVFLGAPRPYLGEDICAAFDFWLPVSDVLSCDLARQLFPGGRGPAASPPTPMHVKRTLEQAMVAARVPFLLNTHPAGVLWTAGGRVAGALLVHRGGREAVVAARVVDATGRGLVARQAGVTFRPFRGTARIRHVTIGGPTIRRDGVDAIELAPMRTEGKDGPVELPARAYRLAVELDSEDPGSPARARADVVERCWAPGVFQQSEWLDTTALDLTAEPHRIGAWPGGAALPLDVLEVRPGLSVLGRAAPIGPEAAEALSRPAHAMAVGERLGREPDRVAAPLGPFRADCAGSEPVREGHVHMPAAIFRRGGGGGATVAAAAAALPRLGRFDVVVVGGGTGGASAAIGAARAGARTLVLESLSALGGVGTLGQICSYYYGNRVGFTLEIDAGVAGLEPQPFPKPVVWSPAAKMAWLHRECCRAGVDVWFASICAGAWVVGGRVRGVVVAGPGGFGLVEAGAVVDATGNADVAAAAGAEVTSVGPDHVAVQGTGLAGIRPGRHYHNSDHTFSDDCDAEDATQALVSAKEKFKNHFDAGQLVDSRERRQIAGEVTLDPFDFLCDRRYADTVCISSSNFDSHGYTTHPVFLVKPPDQAQLWVQVPLRCLLPRGLDGLLVTGLGISAHRDAIPVVRMQADVQNQGYAAGRAAAMVAAGGVPLRALDVRALQRHLVEIGNLPPEALAWTDSPPVDDARLREAVTSGWDDPAGLATIFREPERSRLLLRAAFDRAEGPCRLRHATILGLMGDAYGSRELIAHLDVAEWDKGWSYRGMGQYGASVSPIDTALIALGGTGDPAGWPKLLRFCATLPADPAFSHCRALAEAFERLSAAAPHPDAATALVALLGREGMAGHAHTSLAEVQAALTSDTNETRVRDRALRELHLARGAHRSGGHPAAMAVLRRYAEDLRGHFARHARAVLALPVAPVSAEAAM